VRTIFLIFLIYVSLSVVVAIYWRRVRMIILFRILFPVFYIVDKIIETLYCGK
jgi:hypothetical protein